VDEFFLVFLLHIHRGGCYFLLAPLLKRIDPLELLVAGGKRKTWKIDADIRMKRFCHSKEIGILFLLFCSAEPQKDLVIIRIESLLLRVQQTTEMFFFPFFIICWLGSGWDNNKSDAMHWEYLSFVIPLKSILIWCCLLYYIFYTPWTFVSIWCSNKFEKCQEFSYGPKSYLFVCFVSESQKFFPFVTFNWNNDLDQQMN
jgi:hypothetical protein